MVFTTMAVKAKIVIQEKVVNDAIGFSFIFQNGYILHLFTSFDKPSGLKPEIQTDKSVLDLLNDPFFFSR